MQRDDDDVQDHVFLHLRSLNSGWLQAASQSAKPCCRQSNDCKTGCHMCSCVCLKLLYRQWLAALYALLGTVSSAMRCSYDPRDF